MQNAFEIGCKVYVKVNRTGEWKKTTVEKIYKNGNLKLTGFNGQWRSNTGSIGTYAVRTGESSGYTFSPIAYLATQKIEDLVVSETAENKFQQRLYAAMKTIADRAKSTKSLEVLEALENAASKL